MTASNVDTGATEKPSLRLRMAALLTPMCAAVGIASAYTPSMGPLSASDKAAVCFNDTTMAANAQFSPVSLYGPEDHIGERQSDKRLWNPLAKTYLSAEQSSLLSLAYDIGFMHGGKSHAKLVQAVLMQESLAGALGRIGHLTAPVGKRSYGVMQVKVTAARDVLRKYPGLGHFATDEELIAKLISDDGFNIRVASRYLKYLRAQTKSDMAALVAYNIGPTNARTVEDPAQFAYVARVQRYLAEVVEPFNHAAAKAEETRYTAM